MQRSGRFVLRRARNLIGGAGRPLDEWSGTSNVCLVGLSNFACARNLTVEFGQA